MSYEELKKLSTDELTNELIRMDYILMSDHNAGHYVKCPWVDSKSDEDEKLRAKNIDIIGLCITGISAYNKISLPNANDTEKFLDNVIQNLEMYLEHGNIPGFMQRYYIDVLNRRNINYLNDYLLNNDYENEGQDKSKRISKSTAAGRALSEKESAFVSVLILPAMLVLLYISVVVIYFIFFYNGG